MGWGIGRWRSWGGRLRSRAFEEQRAQALRWVESSMRPRAERVQQQATQQQTELSRLAEAFAPRMGAADYQAGAFRGLLPRQERVRRGGETAREFFETTPPTAFPYLRGVAAGVAAPPPPPPPGPPPPYTGAGPGGLFGTGITREGFAETGRAIGRGVEQVPEWARGVPGLLMGERSEVAPGRSAEAETVPLVGTFPFVRPGQARGRLLEEGPQGQTAIMTAGGERVVVPLANVRGREIGILPAQRREVEFFRPVNEPVGRFLGRGFGEFVIPRGVPGRERAVGVLEKAGGAAFSETAVPSTFVPIPVVDDVLKVLARGAPIAAKLLTREGRMASRVELRELLQQIRGLGRTSPEVARQADLAITEIERALLRPEEEPRGLVRAQAPVEQVARPPEEALPIAREPTVRQVDLEGRQIDTFATERELAGIRETQAALPLEPARRSLYDNIQRDLTEELSIARTAVPERVPQLEQEQILLRANEGVDPEATLAGLRAEMDDIAFELNRRGLRFGGRQGLSVRQAARQRFRGRGVSQQRVPGSPEELQTRFDALDSLASRVEAEFPAVGARTSITERPPANELLPANVTGPGLDAVGVTVVRHQGRRGIIRDFFVPRETAEPTFGVEFRKGQRTYLPAHELDLPPELADRLSRAYPESRLASPGARAAEAVPPPAAPAAQAPPGRPGLRGAAELGPQEPPVFPAPEGAIPEPQRRFPGMEPLPSERQPVLGQLDQPGSAYDRRLHGDDIVGRELDRASMPPQRQVEAGSRRLPPADRARLAGEVTNVRRPMRSFSEVMQDVGDLFQKDWWTQFTDFIGRAIGPGRAVRSAVIRSRLYSGIEGARMRLAFREWIGRHKDTLRLATRGPDRGKALAVQMVEGAEAPPELAQRLDHIAAYPEKYAPTAQQQVALDELQDMSTQILRMEQAHGVDVDELLDAYISRVVIKNPIKDEPLTSMRTRLGTRPWYTKQRAIPDLEQGYAAGYRYADPISSMEARFSTSAETIGNQVAVDEVKRRGKLPSATVRKNLAENLANAQGEYQAARRAALKTGSLQDRAVAEAAQAQLDNAKRAMRGEAIRVSQKRPLRFGRLVDPDVAQALDRYIERVPETWSDDFFRILRTLRINADMGSAGLQNWHTLFRNPVAWTKAMGFGTEAIARDPYDWLIRNADFIDEAIRFQGARVPTEFLLAEGGSISQRLGRFPVIRESQRFFEWNIFVAQVERWKGVRRALLNPDGTFDVKAALDMGATLRKQSGVILMPGLTQRQLRALSKIWFAHQFTTALNSAFVEPPIALARGIARGGSFRPAEREAVRSWVSAFGGAAGLTVAGSLWATGELPNMDDPDKPGFWGIRIGGGYVYPFGPYQPLIVALVRTGRAADDLRAGRTPSARDLQAWPSYIEMKTSIPARFALRAAEALGIPLERVRGRPFTRPELIRPGREGWSGLLDFMMEEVSPIGPQQLAEGIREGAPITALEPFGGRTTIETASQEKRRLFEEKYQREYNPDVDWLLVEGDPELLKLRDQARKDAIERGFESSMEADERRRILAQREQELGLPDIARRALAGDREAASLFANVFQGYEGDRAITSARDFFEGDERKLDSEIGKAYGEYVKISLSDYWDAAALQYDYDSYHADKERALARVRQLDPKIAAAIEARLVSQDATVRKAEQQFKPARRVFRELVMDIPRYAGLSIKDQHYVQDFLADVRQARSDRTITLQPGQELEDMEDTIKNAARHRGMSKRLEAWALALNSTSQREANINQRYVDFLGEHFQDLEFFYRDLYPRYILDLLKPSQKLVPAR